MRTANLEYKDSYNRMISSLERGIPRPKVVIGKTKLCSRSVSSDYDQPCPKVRRAGFTDCLQFPDQRKKANV